MRSSLSPFTGLVVLLLAGPAVWLEGSGRVSLLARILGPGGEEEPRTARKHRLS